jgi:hypothetical protein
VFHLLLFSFGIRVYGNDADFDLMKLISSIHEPHAFFAMFAIVTLNHNSDCAHFLGQSAEPYGRLMMKWLLNLDIDSVRRYIVPKLEKGDLNILLDSRGFGSDFPDMFSWFGTKPDMLNACADLIDLSKSHEVVLSVFLLSIKLDNVDLMKRALEDGEQLILDNWKVSDTRIHQATNSLFPSIYWMRQVDLPFKPIVLAVMAAALEDIPNCAQVVLTVDFFEKWNIVLDMPLLKRFSSNTRDSFFTSTLLVICSSQHSWRRDLLSRLFVVSWI